MKTDRSYGTFAVLRHGAFRWIWAGAMLSNVGNWMEAVAQSWLVQQQTASPFMVELLAASEFVPHALLMLAAGWLADHYDRRKLLLAGQALMMVLGAVLAVAAHLGLATPWVVIALAFAEGAAWASVTPSWQALVPALVPRACWGRCWRARCSRSPAPPSSSTSTWRVSPESWSCSRWCACHRRRLRPRRPRGASSSTRAASGPRSSGRSTSAGRGG
ncbi:MAG: MFS transporter [Deltaproteobacteria bacterium]|nr:MAG: MFS transporter [Deltaproteobacteria bacterium]